MDFQLFINAWGGKSILFWVWASECIKKFKHNIQNLMGILMHLQSMIHEGKSLQDDLRLQYYNNFSSSTIILNLRFGGASSRSRNPKGARGFPRSSFPKGEKLNQGQVNGGTSFKVSLKGWLLPQLNQIRHSIYTTPIWWSNWTKSHQWLYIYYKQMIYIQHLNVKKSDADSTVSSENQWIYFSQISQLGK